MPNTVERVNIEPSLNIFISLTTLANKQVIPVFFSIKIDALCLAIKKMFNNLKSTATFCRVSRPFIEYQH